MIQRYKYPILVFLFFLIPVAALPQLKSLNILLSDSSLKYGSVSFCAIETESGKIIAESGSSRSLVPASILKIVTSAAAIELLGPDYRFRTTIGYTGNLNRQTGLLTGDIVVSGGGDPSFASKRFESHYGDIINNWVKAIAAEGIRRIEGRIITDDSYYDYLPVPAKWLWEDAGNYYGAGAYGFSVFDNTYEIRFRRSAVGNVEIAETDPVECRMELSGSLRAEGTSDKGYVFAAPYSESGWLTGTIPERLETFALKASIPDPPALFSRILWKKLSERGITITKEATTVRKEKEVIKGLIYPLAEVYSPPLSVIAETLNHESVNLYAEHFLKELGKKFRNSGSTDAGLEVVSAFLGKAGIDLNGIFMEDGSGVSPLNSVNSKEMARLLVYMKNSSEYFDVFYNSLPDAGKEGTLKGYFTDPVLEPRMRAKSGSMTRVRSYAGYLKTLDGKTIAFTIIVNNYTGPSKPLIASIGDILKELVLYKQ